jgi:hypothetical protein
MAQSTAAIRRWSPAIVTLVAMAALTAPADAAPRQARPEVTTEATAPRNAGEPLMAIVSVKTQKVTLYDADGWILRAPVSSGTKGRETPAGVFSVLQKDKDHHSNLYDDAWMPNMLRITWSGIALHGGPLPGYAASHGCVRMPYGFAEKLFDKVRIGMRVIIAPDDSEPVEFSHPALFVPKPEVIAAAPARAERLAREADVAAKTALGAKNAAASLRNLEGLKARADAAFASAEKGFAAAKTDQAKARAEDQKQKAAAKVAELQTQLDAARASAKSNAEAAAQDAAKAAREAKLALQPVSVFISRATQKIYVRRPTRDRAPEAGEMFDTILEVPITIRNPDKPIGTHVFTAVAPANRGLRWTAVTIDGGDNAKAALDRITIPQEVLEHIAPTAVARSSIVISDEPLHRETNYRTEFVVALHDQPQGGLAMRKRPAEVRTARRDDGSNRRSDWNSWGGGQYYNQRQNGGFFYQRPW